MSNLVIPDCSSSWVIREYDSAECEESISLFLDGIKTLRQIFHRKLIVHDFFSHLEFECDLHLIHMLVEFVDCLVDKCLDMAGDPHGIFESSFAVAGNATNSA